MDFLPKSFEKSSHCGFTVVEGMALTDFKNGDWVSRLSATGVIGGF
jgi:hypothetical protein